VSKKGLLFQNWTHQKTRLVRLQKHEKYMKTSEIPPVAFIGGFYKTVVMEYFIHNMNIIETKTSEEQETKMSSTDIGRLNIVC